MAGAGKDWSAALKLRVEINGEACTLDLQMKGSEAAYTLNGVWNATGHAWIEVVSTGIFSVLINNRSVLVYAMPHADGTELWVGLNRYLISAADARDKAANSAKTSAKGPAELRAQMPGKIIKLLVEPGETIKGGQGLIVVEAMKMQNEVKSPKDGIVAKIHVAEGATVSAGDLLMVVV